MLRRTLVLVQHIVYGKARSIAQVNGSGKSKSPDYSQICLICEILMLLYTIS
jgi:hypothetical protein